MFSPLRNSVRLFNAANIVKIAHNSFASLPLNRSNINRNLNILNIDSTQINSAKQFLSSQKKTVTLFFIDRDGDKLEAKAKVGTNLLDVALDNNIDLEGACEGTLSCSTCHLIFEESNYDQLKEPSDEEEDMLDLAFGLTDTSRLGCQIIVEENMEGWVMKVPAETADARDV